MSYTFVKGDNDLKLEFTGKTAETLLALVRDWRELNEYSHDPESVSMKIQELVKQITNFDNEGL